MTTIKAPPVDTTPSSAVYLLPEEPPETITPPRGLRAAFRRAMELYQQHRPWMLILQGGEQGVKIWETKPPGWEAK